MLVSVCVWRIWVWLQEGKLMAHDWQQLSTCSECVSVFFKRMCASSVLQSGGTIGFCVCVCVWINHYNRSNAKLVQKR